MLFENGGKQTWFTESTCARSVCRQRMDCRSKTLVVWSIDEVTKKSPISWNAQDHTACGWSVKVCVQFSLIMSHILTVASPLVVATMEPFGWNAMSLTQSLWPSPLMTSSPLGLDHNFHVWSSLAVPMTGSFGWKATRAIEPKCPLNVRWSLVSCVLKASKVMFKYGFGRSSCGSYCIICFCMVSFLAEKRPRSRRISIFSFIAHSYLCRSSVKVGSYCS